ncbi:hypothetical protein ACFW35_18405 [Fictibacillus sp. NPDC058756]|uniref:hypothetical protein n=1 Tax=Fictibacillus sp. NPDC058756 TaxID=3346625 RepID=UPI0036801CBE
MDVLSLGDIELQRAAKWLYMNKKQMGRSYYNKNQFFLNHMELYHLYMYGKLLIAD